MNHILVAGAGRIGRLLACFLANTDDYQVHLVDSAPIDLDFLTVELNLAVANFDVLDQKSFSTYCQQHNIQVVVSCLPYFANQTLIKLADECQLDYFDLTEDVDTFNSIRELAKNKQQVFMPACGLAPGYVNIVANDLMQGFEALDSVKLRVGCLPLVTDNSLRYALTWSTDGLINEYGNECDAIQSGKRVKLQPLEGLESVELDGIIYEAFNTSGGIGSLVESYYGKVKNLNYKTLRYPGHCDRMRFLMKELKLNDDRATLKSILENALPKISQDVVFVYVAATGQLKNQLRQKNYVDKFYPRDLFGRIWSSIQITTAASACAVIDIIQTNRSKYHGLVLQENIQLKQLQANRFGVIMLESRKQ